MPLTTIASIFLENRVYLFILFISFYFLQTNKTSTCMECRGTASNGPSGAAEVLSSCSGCGRSLHTTCANKLANVLTQPVPLSILVKKGSKWMCRECQSTCGACKNTNSNRGACLLMCCTCDKNYHLCCLDPVPVKKPKCPWR